MVRDERTITNGTDTEIISSIEGSLFAVEEFQAERTALIYPFFLLNDVTDIEIGNPKTGPYFAIKPHQAFQAPRDFARRVHRVVEQRLQLLPRPIPKLVAVGSLRQIAKDLDVKWHGETSERIKQAFRGIKAAIIQSKGGGEFVTSLYDFVYFTGDTLPDGRGVAEQVYISLADWYVENFNKNNIRHLETEFFNSLTSNEQRLYELIGAKFYGLFTVVLRDEAWELVYRDPKARFLNYNYSTLCELFPLNRKKYLSKDIRLPKAIKGLIEKGFFTEETTWEKLGKDGFGEQWKFRFYPGEVARAEIYKYLVRAAEEKGAKKALPVRVHKSQEEIDELAYYQLDVMGDKHSLPMYMKLAKYCPRNKLERILHEVKSEDLETDDVRDRRKLYIHRCKEAFPDLFSKTKSES